MSNDESASPKDHLSRIPLSRKVIWQTVRMRAVPPLVLLCMAAAVVYQWRHMAAGGVAALAEGNRSVVTCPRPSFITEIKVQPYQYVEAGQPLVVLKPSDPRIGLDILQSELQLARLQGEPSLAEQNALDYERLRVEQLRLKEEIAFAAVNLQRSEAALKRNALLRSDKLVSEDAYDLSLRDRDINAAEIEQKKSALAQIEARMGVLSAYGEPDKPREKTSPLDPLDEIRSKLTKAEADLSTVTLVAPISGMVHGIDRQQGDFLVEGDPIFTVYATRSDRVITYLRQPYPLEPQVGMKVEVLTRTQRRERFIAEVTQVGAQLETITNSLAFLKPGALVDVGLPVVVALPAQANIRPGETVDLGFLSGPEPKAPLSTSSLGGERGM